MTSLEVRILEYWVQDRGSVRHTWQRDPTMERPLVHLNWDSGGHEDQGVWDRILDSDGIDEWRQLRRGDDVAAMTAFLIAFDCERPAEVAHMFDVERRYRLFRDEVSAVRAERFGKN